MGIVAMGNRLANSYAFRSQHLYRGLLRLMPKPRVRKTRMELLLLSMCGTAHVEMLEACLYSIARKWTRLPSIRIVSDGTLSVASLRERLAWWPQPATVVNWDEYLPYHAALGRTELVEYAGKSAFGRKLAAIAAESERQNTFWCDADVLFFGDFCSALRPAAHASPFVLSMQDFQYSYDDSLVCGDLAYLLQKPAVNTGLVLCRGNFYDAAQLAPLVRAGIALCNGLTEQTILAHAVHVLGAIEWDLKAAQMFGDDGFRIRAGPLRDGGLARHYVGVWSRHLFWRDAFALRTYL
jgi:hypothetical protein